jgi:hypothetical protein
MILSIAALMVAGSLAAAVPAHAADNAPPCTPEAPQSPPMGSLYIDENGVIQVNPGALPDDAVAQGGWAVDWTVFMVFCLESKLPTDGVWCNVALALEIAGSMDPLNLYLRYVYPNGQGGYSIDVPRLLSDSGRAVACHLTT